MESSGWRHPTARSAIVLLRIVPTSSCVHRRDSDRLRTRCRALELPRVAVGEATPAGGAPDSHGTSSSTPLAHLGGTDPRCNDRYHGCRGVFPGTAPSCRAAARPPQFLQTGKTAYTRPSPAAATYMAQVDVAPKLRQASERDSGGL